MRKLHTEDGVAEFKSRIDSAFDVSVVYSESEHYDAIKEIIPKGDVAFTDLRTKIIIVDGEQLAQLTNDHLLFVEAHEIAHHLLNHIDQYDNPEQEKEADMGAYIMLTQRGHKKAAELVKYYFKHRHKTKFDKFNAEKGEEIVKRLGL